LELLERVDDALERAVVIDPGHIEIFSIHGLEARIRFLKARFEERRALLDVHRLRRLRSRGRARRARLGSLLTCGGLRHLAWARGGAEPTKVGSNPSRPNAEVPLLSTV